MVLQVRQMLTAPDEVLHLCCGAYNRFRVESVLDLKKNLTSHGSDLLVRYGTPEELVPALYKFLVEKGFQPVEVFIHREVNTTLHQT